MFFIRNTNISCIEEKQYKEGHCRSKIQKTTKKTKKKPQGTKTLESDPSIILVRVGGVASGETRYRKSNTRDDPPHQLERVPPQTGGPKVRRGSHLGLSFSL